MMEWLWIPAVALLSVFFLALCCYFFSDYTCCPCRRKRYPKSYLPSTVNEAHFNRTNDASHRPSAPLQTPEDSPLIKLKLGDKKLSEIIFKQDNINTLDLHGMTVIEAIYAVQGFIQRQRSIGTPSTKIITGRGIHSTDGEAKLKPAIRNVLMVENLEFYEADKGGSYLIRM